MTIHSRTWCAMALALLTTTLAHGQGEGPCPAGSIQDCADSDCVPEGWVGDLYCDGYFQDYGADLCCYEQDGGDCDEYQCPLEFCGDGLCDEGYGEDYYSCPQDCEPTVICGDGYCDEAYGEDYFSCPSDCPTPPICGDGLCDDFLGEDYDTCPSDCTPPDVCGDGLCDPAWEDYASCPEDCDSCPDDPDKSEPGVCGCGIPDTDSDLDGTLDCEDGCPDDPDKTEPGHCGCGSPETTTFGDVDCDGDFDAEDARASMAIFGIVEAGACRADTNGDGVVDGMDLSAVLANWGLPCTGG